MLIEPKYTYRIAIASIDDIKLGGPSEVTELLLLSDRHVTPYSAMDALSLATQESAPTPDDVTWRDVLDVPVDKLAEHGLAIEIENVNDMFLRDPDWTIGETHYALPEE